jgi:MOSC domain-containing protein YiiM
MLVIRILQVNLGMKPANMKLVSLNRGTAQLIAVGERQIRTGIHKQPTLEPVRIGTLGLENDEVSDEINHGGPDQAIYVYGLPDYDHWSEQLGTVIDPATFGENLTISGLESANLRIGDRLRIGPDDQSADRHADRPDDRLESRGVLLEVTASRIPCHVLAARMNDLGFVKKFRAAQRPGAYCRVIQTGEVRTGDTVTLEPYAGQTVSLLEDFNLYYNTNATRAELERALNAPIAIRSHAEHAARLAKLEP